MNRETNLPNQKLLKVIITMAQFTNQATLQYGGMTTSSNVAVGELIAVLTATKTAISTSYNGEGSVVYAVSVVNAGTTAFTGVTVRDNLGAYTFGAQTLYPLTYTAGSLKYYVNGVLQSTAPTIAAGPPLSISGITVPAGGNITLIYEAAVNQYAPLGAGSSITNTVTVTADGLTVPLTDTATVNAESAARLTIAKAICPVTVTEKGEVTYTFIIQNHGNTAVTEGIVISDTFDPILTNLAVTFNGAAWTAPTNYTYEAATGEFATVAGNVTVPAATYTQDTATGRWSVTPGTSTLMVKGTI